MKKITPRDQGNAYEIYLAKKLEGKLISGSGSVNTTKEDIKLPDWLIQAKNTEGESHSIKKKDLHKLREHAINASRIPLYVVGFTEYQKIKEEWVALPLELFELFLQKGFIE